MRNYVISTVKDIHSLLLFSKLNNIWVGSANINDALEETRSKIVYTESIEYAKRSIVSFEDDVQRTSPLQHLRANECDKQVTVNEWRGERNRPPVVNDICKQLCWYVVIDTKIKKWKTIR